MAYTNPEMSSLLRSGAAASQEPSAAEGWADALNNPAYLAHWEVAEPSMELASGGETQHKTLTQSMAAASISEPLSTYASLPRPPMPRPMPQQLVLFQRGGPQALEMYHVPPPTPTWNARASAEQFIYEGEARPASAPPQTMEGEVEEEYEENVVQVDAVAEETEEEEEETISIPAWQNPNTKRRARQVVALLNQDVLDAMPTDNLIWIMQAGFQSLMSRRVHH